MRRHPLEAYATSYEQMGREGDGRVDCTSVVADIRQNMIPATSASALYNEVGDHSQLVIGDVSYYEAGKVVVRVLRHTEDRSVVGFAWDGIEPPEYNTSLVSVVTRGLILVNGRTMTIEEIEERLEKLAAASELINNAGDRLLRIGMDMYGVPDEARKAYEELTSLRRALE